LSINNSTYYIIIYSTLLHWPKVFRAIQIVRTLLYIEWPVIINNYYLIIILCPKLMCTVHNARLPYFDRNIYTYYTHRPHAGPWWLRFARESVFESSKIIIIVITWYMNTVPMLRTHISRPSDDGILCIYNTRRAVIRTRTLWPEKHCI